VFNEPLQNKRGSFYLLGKRKMKELIEKIKEQIAQIKNEILMVTDQIELIRQEGDDADVSLYTELLDKSNMLREKIEQLQKNLSVYQNSTESETIDIGNTVEISMGSMKKSLTLVLPEDVDTSNGLISVDSPIGQALFQKKKGADVTVDTPNGKIEYKVLEVN
jgi:transcription elongation factor GreA